MTAAPVRPTVSVVIPCFNQARYLRAAVESVRRQSHAPIEHIVVDDGSTDDTGAVARSLSVALIRQPNKGVSEARNAGLAAAHGDLIVFLDADDELLPDGIAIGAGALAANPHVSVVVGRCQAMNAAGESVPTQHYHVDPDNLYREWLTRNFVWTPGAAMFRRGALAQAGGFPFDLGAAADYAVYLRFARSGSVLYHLNEVVRYRQHETSMSRDPAMMLRLTLEVLRRERRAAPPQMTAEIRRAQRAWCSWYGEQIPDHVRKQWQAGRRGRAELGSLWTFVRCCPRSALRRAAQKLARTAAAATGAARRSARDGAVARPRRNAR